MIRKSEIEAILQFVEQQKQMGKDLKIVGFEYRSKQRFDFLLWDKISEHEIEVEVTEMHLTYDDGVSYKGRFNSVLRGKRPAVVLSNKKRYLDNPAWKFNTGVHEIGGEQGENFKGLKRIIEKKSKQFSDKPNRIRMVLIVNEYHFGDPAELRPAANRIIDRDGIETNVDEIYFLDKKGFFETGRIEQIYPNSEGTEEIVEFYAEEDEEGNLNCDRGRIIKKGPGGEILSITQIEGESK